MKIFMNFFKIISLLLRFSQGIKFSRGIIVIVMLAGLIGGISNTVLIALVNSSLSKGGVVSAGFIWGFVGLCITLPVTRFISGILLVRLMERAAFDLRMQLCRQVLAAPLRLLEEVGSSRVLATFASDVPTISNALITLPLLSMHIAILMGCLIYLGWLSWTLLVGVVGFMSLGIITHQIPVSKSLKYFRRAREDTDALYKHFRALTQGIKELKLHHRRRRSFVSELFEPTALSMQQQFVTGNTIYSAAGSWGQALFFVATGLVLFLVPSLKAVSPAMLTGYTLTIIYMMGPLEVILNTLPQLSRAAIAMKQVESLGLSLTSQPLNDERGAESDPQQPWELLELVEVAHSYSREGEESDFVLGPITLTFRPRELVFLIGGNGSGKTTLAKLIIGLYMPEGGEIRLNGEPVIRENRDYYRQHFSVVFSDFYLFDSLLGLEAPDLDSRARDYLAQLQLDRKVQIKQGTLSTTDLSQGQRKRLALLTAYLEDRPIYLFDEWAADQDPMFKEVFYFHLLPELRARGKTVIVISHDDRYYHLADRIIKLDYGKLEYDRQLKTSKIATIETTTAFGQ